MSRFTLVTVLTLLLLDRYETIDDIISRLSRKKCFDELGCFSAGPPYFDTINRPWSLLPDERKDINTQFLLYTTSNPEVPKNFSNLDDSMENLQESAFNSRVNIKFIVPGFLSDFAPEWKNPIIKALLRAYGSNVFFVDWSGGAGRLYEQAVANSRIVGAEIALFIKRMQTVADVPPGSIHIIGFSLGSHIAGYAGKNVTDLGRITGLDPGGLYFTRVNPVVRLSRTDAHLVDVIHTNAAATVIEGFGLPESIGHFDFYPNGGYLQPGCKNNVHNIFSFIKNPTWEGFQDIQCNHMRAVQLFISSISSPKCNMTGATCDSWDNFVAGKCGTCGSRNNNATCLTLGMHADLDMAMIQFDRSINIYLNTTETEPYCV